MIPEMKERITALIIQGLTTEKAEEHEKLLLEVLFMVDEDAYNLLMTDQGKAFQKYVADPNLNSGGVV